MKKFVPKFLLNQQGVIPLVVIVAAGIIGSSGVTVAASQKAIPGDALYPVKKVTENVRVATAFSKQDKAKIHLAIAEEKVKEIEKLEEKGKTDKIAEAAQELEESQEEALELTQDIKSEGQNVDELVELLEVQSGKQQIVLTRISNNIPQQINESLAKSLEQFREQLKVIVESDEEDEKEEEEDTKQEEADSESPSQTPCPSPSSSEDENNYQEYEDVQGISQLRNSQGSSYGRDPCDSAEGSSGAGSHTFDGGTGSEGTTIDGSGASEGGQGVGVPAGTPVGQPTSPTVKGVSANRGLLQLILDALFPSQVR